MDRVTKGRQGEAWVVEREELAWWQNLAQGPVGLDSW